jgi:hypothetical protein
VLPKEPKGLLEDYLKDHEGIYLGYGLSKIEVIKSLHKKLHRDY